MRDARKRQSGWRTRRSRDATGEEFLRTRARPTDGGTCAHARICNSPQGDTAYGVPLLATFRGRTLRGAEVTLPEGFSGPLAGARTRARVCMRSCVRRGAFGP